nr:reverse transcriptase domain-containing protein [Tanacetum cinerariifolium]
GGEVVVWAVAGGESGGGAVGRWQWCCMSVAAGCNGDDDGSGGDNGVVSVEMMGLIVVAVVDMVAAAFGFSGVGGGVVMEMWRLGCMATVGGESDRSGDGKCFWGSPEKFTGKLFRWLRLAAGGRKWWWWPAAGVVGGEREREREKKPSQIFGAVAGEACYRLSVFKALSALEILYSRSRIDPSLLNDSEMAAEGPGDLPVLDLRTMEELCQPSLNGRGGPIAPIAIQATNFRLKNDMIQQVQNSCQFHVTKLRNEITNFRQRPDESLFESWERYNLSIDRCPNQNMLPVTKIDTFYNGLTLRHRDTINVAGGTYMKRRPEEYYDLIENMTAHHND